MNAIWGIINPDLSSNLADESKPSARSFIWFYSNLNIVPDTETSRVFFFFFLNA